MPSTSIKTAAVGLAVALAAPVSAFWRMPCPGRLALERIDPIISPGEVSGHVHTVSGGSGFGFTTNFDQQRASACSSCPIKSDLSAYWTPKLYYQAEDGHFEDVLQSGEGDGTTGGLTVYYEQRGFNKTGGDAKPIPFPDGNGPNGTGFRMVAGNPFQRNYTDAVGAPGQAVKFTCLNYAEGSSNYTSIPNVNCPDGLRAEVYFPSCWNGVDYDSDNHTAHMAYPIGQYDDGVCPDSHPVQLISIFFEVLYSIDQFADRWYNPDKHPFVFASGDATGYGFHGDFVNGWNHTFLGYAIGNCTDDSGNMSDCELLQNDLFSNEQCQACKIPPQVNEQVTGNLTSLPGCNPVTYGPEPATPPECENATISTPQQLYTDVTSSLEWAYAGCANDSNGVRTLQGASTSSDDMTIQTCIKYCKDQGYSLAGLEYASQCYCDNDYAVAGNAPLPNVLGNCWQPCAGNANQICGGADALSVYKACDGGACSNDEFKVNGTSTSTRKKRHLHGSGHSHGHLHLY